MKRKSRVESILDLKSRLFLTIFGSYDSEALGKLELLKLCLINRGYDKCDLVANRSFPTKRSIEENDEYFRRKSIYWLENSDACVFVFLHSVNNEGVAFELKHTCDHLEAKLETCLVAIESKCVKYSTSLIRGTVTTLVKQKKLNRRFFRGEQQLCKFCSSGAISFLKKRRFYLLERSSP